MWRQTSRHLSAIQEEDILLPIHSWLLTPPPHKLYDFCKGGRNRRKLRSCVFSFFYDSLLCRNRPEDTRISANLQESNTIPKPDQFFAAKSFRPSPTPAGVPTAPRQVGSGERREGAPPLMTTILMQPLSIWSSCWWCWCWYDWLTVIDIA